MTSGPATETRPPERAPAWDVEMSRAGLVATGALLVLAAWVTLSYPVKDAQLGDTAGVLQVAILVTASIGMGFSIGTPPRTAMIILWTFVYSLVGFVQTIQLSQMRNPFGAYVAAEDLLVQQTIVLAGSVVAHVVYTLTLRYRTPDDAQGARWQLSLQRVVALGCAALVLVPLLIAQVGGISPFFTSRYEIQLAFVNESTNQTLVTSLASILAFMPVLALLHLRLARVFRFSDRIEITALFLALLPLNVIVNNPISQPRYWVATIGIAGLLLWRRALDERGQAAFAVFLVVAACVIFPYLDAFRYDAFGSTSIQKESLTQSYLYTTDYGSAQDITNVVSLTRADGHTYGRQLLGAALFFVPRAWWPDKPLNTAELIGRHLNFPNLNLDTPLWAEGYVDFGWPGALLIMALFGFLAAWVQRHWDPLRRTTATAAVFVPVFVGYELILLRGSLLQAMFKIVVLALVALAMSRRGAADPIEH